MNCLQKQIIYNDSSISNEGLSTINDEIKEDLDENRNCLSDVQFQNEEDNIKSKLRNSLRSSNKLNNLKNGTINPVRKVGNSLFDQLIKEAKIAPTSDFELTSSFFEEQKQFFKNGQKEQNLQQNDLCLTNEESTKKVNRRKDQIELIDDFEDQSDISSFTKEANNMKEISPKKNIQDLNLKELKNFKNHQNGLDKSVNKTSNKLSNLNRLEIKPVQRIFIDDNLFKYNDGLVGLNNFNFESINSSTKCFLKKKNTIQIFENKRLLSNFESDHFLESNDMTELNSPLSFNKFNSINQCSLANNQSNSIDNTSKDLMDNFLLFNSLNESSVFDFFTFQDNSSSFVDHDDCQTSIVALIQFKQISIWTKLASQTEWTRNFFKLEDNQQVFRCLKIEKDNFVCILFLVFSHSLVSLKYCLIDKLTKTVQLVHCETFEVSNYIDLNLIHLCFINPCFIALSIPRIDDDIVDFLIYDQFYFQNYEFNKSKRIIFMLNNIDNKFSSLNNCFLASDELDNVFLAIFNQKLFMCNVTEFSKLPKMISLRKFANSNYSYFDVLYDKGIFYIFAGDIYMNIVRIIALNIDRFITEKLIKYDIEKALADKFRDNEERNSNLDDEVRIFKRKGDHLLIIKNDKTVALFNLFNDEIVYQTKLNYINETAIAILNRRTRILAVLKNQYIVNLVDL